MKKLTPVLVVDAIEPALPFWVDRLGFEVTAEVPHGDHLGFVILSHGPVELMLQTRASVAADIPALAAEPNRATLFLELDDLAPIRALEPEVAEVVVAERQTFYGAREIGLRVPGDHVVIFAAFSGRNAG